jgi:hypothetical protein
MKRKLDRTDKRNLTAADVAIFMKSYGRQRQKRREPNKTSVLIYPNDAFWNREKEIRMRL